MLRGLTGGAPEDGGSSQGRERAYLFSRITYIRAGEAGATRGPRSCLKFDGGHLFVHPMRRNDIYPKGACLHEQSRTDYGGR